VSADIIQFIPRPKRDDARTDFPAIVFRSARQDPAVDPVNAASDERSGSTDRET
jgi:hypothetical protein